ncbi:Imm15 family immunity protein [Pseudomonas putida]|uniref:Imm15 family immunity protein n=1 Tax=Pseudomonas putida TaxID=303 RepID=UPI0013658AD8|nr:Imm15 family immunity protein [Pseudomonas putida]
MQKLFDKLVEKEPYINLNVFLEEHETFEEIPIISRYKKLEILKANPQQSEAADILLNISFFVLNSAMLYMRTKKAKNEEHFIAITYTDFNFENKTEPPIPNFFVNPNTTKISSLEKLKKKQKMEVSPEMKLVQERFDACRIRPLFSFYESRFFDPACNEDIIRVYAVLN